VGQIASISSSRVASRLGDEAGEDLERALEPAFDGGFSIGAALLRRGRAQQAEDERRALVRRPGWCRPRGPGPAGARFPAQPLALEPGRKKARDAVALRPFGPQAAAFQERPGGAGIGRVAAEPLGRGGQQQVELVGRETVEHLVAQEEADRRDLQQKLGRRRLQTAAAGGLDGQAQRAVPAVARLVKAAGDRHRRRASGEELPKGGDLARPEEKLLRRQEGDLQSGIAPAPFAGEQQALPGPQQARHTGQALAGIAGNDQPADSGLIRLVEARLQQRPIIGEQAQGKAHGRRPLPFQEGGEQRGFAAARPAPDLHQRLIERCEARDQALRLRKEMRRLGQRRSRLGQRRPARAGSGLGSSLSSISSIVSRTRPAARSSRLRAARQRVVILPMLDAR
jgi:hypothetical protein